MWDKRFVEKVDAVVSYFSVSCRFWNVVDQHECAFLGVYGCHIDRVCQLMWTELGGIASWWDVPRCIRGDFNVIRFPSERLGAERFTTERHDFSEFISSFGLMDILLEGGRFTWSNNREAFAMSRIDRFLYSAGWEDCYPTITQRRSPKILSNHFPILLECGHFTRG